MENPRRLYYLDDDTDDLHFFREAAESLGHNVEIFVNGTMMLKALKKETLPDIIFLDIRMPVFDGEQILDILKRTNIAKISLLC
jgi:CheY-like chemotaxis protein